MTSPIGFPPETVYEVTGITKDSPGIVSVSTVAEPDAFFLVNGMTITFSGVIGMYEVNRNRYIIGSLDTNALTFALYTNQGIPVDTSSFNSYVSGGQINITSYPPLAGQPPGLMYNTQPINV
jgi:hypothetical protein